MSDDEDPISEDIVNVSKEIVERILEKLKEKGIKIINQEKGPKATMFENDIMSDDFFYDWDKSSKQGLEKIIEIIVQNELDKYIGMAGDVYEEDIIYVNKPEPEPEPEPGPQPESKTCWRGWKCLGFGRLNSKGKTKKKTKRRTKKKLNKSKKPKKTKKKKPKKSKKKK